MKRLSTKFLLGYLIFGILGFLTIAFFSSHLTQQYLLRTTGENLYDHASLLAQECVELYGDTMPDLTQAQPRMEAMATYTGATAWLMDRQGQILFDTSHKDTRHVIKEFNHADAGHQNYTISDF